MTSDALIADRMGILIMGKFTQLYPFTAFFYIHDISSKTLLFVEII